MNICVFPLMFLYLYYFVCSDHFGHNGKATFELMANVVKLYIKCYGDFYSHRFLINKML